MNDTEITDTNHPKNKSEAKKIAYGMCADQLVEFADQVKKSADHEEKKSDQRSVVRLSDSIREIAESLRARGAAKN